MPWNWPFVGLCEGSSWLLEILSSPGGWDGEWFAGFGIYTLLFVVSLAAKVSDDEYWDLVGGRLGRRGIHADGWVSWERYETWSRSPIYRLNEVSQLLRRYFSGRYPDHWYKVGFFVAIAFGLLASRTSKLLSWWRYCYFNLWDINTNFPNSCKGEERGRTTVAQLGGIKMNLEQGLTCWQTKLVAEKDRTVGFVLDSSHHCHFCT